MVVGNPNQFAIESHISLAYENPGVRALGFFVVYLGGFCFGVRRADATWLACSFDAIDDRLAHRGCHVSLVDLVSDGELISNAYISSKFAPDDLCKEFFAGFDAEEAERLRSIASVSALAPDGDEAFDDGSVILHFDIGDQVRLIGFKSLATYYCCDSSTVRDVSLPADEFYEVLRQWRAAFTQTWNEAPKLFLPSDNSPQHISEIRRLAQLKIPPPTLN